MGAQRQDRPPTRAGLRPSASLRIRVRARATRSPEAPHPELPWRGVSQAAGRRSARHATASTSDQTTAAAHRRGTVGARRQASTRAGGSEDEQRRGEVSESKRIGHGRRELAPGNTPSGDVTRLRRSVSHAQVCGNDLNAGGLAGPSRPDSAGPDHRRPVLPFQSMDGDCFDAERRSDPLDAVMRLDALKCRDATVPGPAFRRNCVPEANDPVDGRGLDVGVPARPGSSRRP